MWRNKQIVKVGKMAGGSLGYFTKRGAYRLYWFNQSAPNYTLLCESCVFGEWNLYLTCNFALRGRYVLEFVYGVLSGV